MAYGRSDAYDALLYEICGEMGFCGDFRDGKVQHVDNHIPQQGKVTADDFVKWVLLAEGMDAEEDAAKQCAPRIREAFVRLMGAEVVNAESFGLS
jgi:hypothetical protein